MNKKEIYCVYDKKSKNYDGFMLFNNMAEAIRAFQMSCEKNEVFNKWPEDFQFVKVAEIEYDQDGFENKVIIVAEAKDFVKQKNEENTK